MKGIKQLADDDRPREKMYSKGRRSMSNAELLAILLGSGNIRENALELAQRILSDFDNNLEKMAGIEASRLMKYSGVGMAKAVTVLAGLELGLRTKTTVANQKIRYNNSRVIFETLSPEMSFISFESFVLLTFNSALELIGKHQISEGGLDATIVDIRKIAYHCVLDKAACIAVAHNHPSGNTMPSKSDDQVTAKIKEMAQLFNYKFIDHLILGGSRYYSYADEGGL